MRRDWKGFVGHAAILTHDLTCGCKAMKRYQDEVPLIKKALDDWGDEGMSYLALVYSCLVRPLLIMGRTQGLEYSLKEAIEDVLQGLKDGDLIIEEGEGVTIGRAA